MNIRTNEALPGYDKESFREFIKIVSTKWNIPQKYIDHSESYFLQHLTAQEIRDILTCDGIELCGISYVALFNRKGIEAYNHILNHGGDRKFWLSFRAIKYPLGTSDPVTQGVAGNLKAYVLIQLDTSPRKV